MGNDVNSKLIKDYLEEYPEMPSLSLAKLIYKYNSENFKNIEDVRGYIRYYRGTNGDIHRRNLTDRRFVRQSQTAYNPFAIPESDELEYESYIIPDSSKKMLVFSDVHIPYHSVSSLSIMLEYAIKNNIDSVLLNGDIVDFYQLSVFTKDPRMRHFTQEIQMLGDFLDVLNRELNCKIFYKYGNHEERFENYMKIKAPELIGIKNFELHNILNFAERKIDWIKDKRIIKFGKLNILHGHELRGSIIPPVNAARGVFLRTKENTLISHFHTDSKHSESTLDEKHISCWSIGCMCGLHPEYAVLNKWVHGFAIIDRLDEEGNFTASIKQIIKNNIV
jgi:predicted phosphodiesterase